MAQQVGNCSYWPYTPSPVQKLPKNTISKVKHLAFLELRKIALDCNGTIFGGFVRDEYIAEYYSEKFYQAVRATGAKSKPESFWDPNYLPATKARLLTPDDMDVSFESNDDASEFIEAVKAKKEFMSVTVLNKIPARKYYGMNIESIRQMIIQIEVGAVPFLHEGKIITIRADIVIPKQSFSQPPFRNIDMLCNGFIITKNHGKQFSRNTGTILDQYSDYERAMVVAQILKDMMNFKTALCFVSCRPPRFRKDMNLCALKRIEKMERKKISWSFINLPFHTMIYGQHEEVPAWKIPEMPSLSGSDSSDNSHSSETYTECGVCMTKFNDGDKISYTTSKNDESGQIIATPHIHYECCMKHLKYQRRNAPIVHNKKFVFHCPFRTDIDFSRCVLDLQFLYKREL